MATLLSLFGFGFFSPSTDDADVTLEDRYCVGMFDCLSKLIFNVLVELYTMLRVNPVIFRTFVLLQLVSIGRAYKDALAKATGR